MERNSGLVHPDGLFHRPNPLKNKIKRKISLTGCGKGPGGRNILRAGILFGKSMAFLDSRPRLKHSRTGPLPDTCRGRPVESRPRMGVWVVSSKGTLLPGAEPDLVVVDVNRFAQLDENPVFGLQKQCSAFREWIPVGGSVLRE